MDGQLINPQSAIEETTHIKITPMVLSNPILYKKKSQNTKIYPQFLKIEL